MSKDQLLSRIRKRQKHIERFVLTRLLLTRDRSVRRTKHFREWLQAPMNYVRIIELPLTYELLDLEVGHSILDISSPKLMSLYLSTSGFLDLTVSDIEDYFVDDFELFSRIYDVHYTIKVFDARSIPFPDATFDRVFSISVLEHIPGVGGDTEVAREVSRILRPNGLFVVTLPAWKHYFEEWQKETTVYWESVQREDGLSFYQRRYDMKTVQDHFRGVGLAIEDVVFIAEMPIEQPRLDPNGMLLHNIYYLENLMVIRYLKKLLRFKVPLLPYVGYRYMSMRYHYLTRDTQDENVRQVAVKFRKE